jgi:hypothetical protein
MLKGKMEFAEDAHGVSFRLPLRGAHNNPRSAGMFRRRAEFTL